MKGTTGVKPILDDVNAVYFEPSTPLPNGGTKIAASTTLQTGDLSVDCMYDVFVTVDDAFIKLALTAGVSAMDLTRDYPLPEKLPWRFYSGRYTKFGIKTTANSGSAWVSKVVGDDDR